MRRRAAGTTGINMLSLISAVVVVVTTKNHLIHRSFRFMNFITVDSYHSLSSSLRYFVNKGKSKYITFQTQKIHSIAITNIACVLVTPVPRSAKSTENVDVYDSGFEYPWPEHSVLVSVPHQVCSGTDDSKVAEVVEGERVARVAEAAKAVEVSEVARTPKAVEVADVGRVVKSAEIHKAVDVAGVHRAAEAAGVHKAVEAAKARKVAKVAEIAMVAETPDTTVVADISVHSDGLSLIVSCDVGDQQANQYRHL